MKIGLKSFTDGNISARERAARKAALSITAENVLADCTQKVPINLGHLGKGETRGDLRRSGRVVLTADGKAYIEYGGTAQTSRYARAQYEKPYTHTAPGVTDHWFEAVQAIRGKAWQEMYAKVLKSKMG